MKKSDQTFPQELKMKVLKLFSAIMLSFVFLGTISSAQAEEGLGVDIKAGTLGGGVELSTSLLDNTRIRGGFNYFTYSFDSTISDINYDFETDFNSLSLLLDWHPFGGSFYLSGGAYFNNNSISAEGTAEGAAIPSPISFLGGITDLVSITGEIEFQPVAPYAGLGWRSNNAEPGWGVGLDLGVLFQGAPDVTNLRVNGPVEVNSIREVRAFLAEQEEEIEDELSVFQFYPVVSLMLIYNF